MSRILMISAAFFSVTIALLVFQPDPDPRAPVGPAGGDVVTRAETGLTGARDIKRPADGLSAAAEQPGPGKGTYVVEPGDTLASIAYRFYGQTSARHQIFEANKDRINASGKLKAGIALVLPAN